MEGAKWYRSQLVRSAHADAPGLLLAIPLAAGAGGVAIASPQFSSTFGLTFSSAAPGSPSGLDVSASWSDPGGVNGVPKAVTKLEFVGHAGYEVRHVRAAALPGIGRGHREPLGPRVPAFEEDRDGEG